MSKNYNKSLLTIMSVDAYRLLHKQNYPVNMTKMFANFTPRTQNWNMYGAGFVIATGIEYAIKKIAAEWEEHFFSLKKKDVVKVLELFAIKVKEICGVDNFNTSHFMELWNHGKLPLEFRALPEGTKGLIGVPVLTVNNTEPQFAWFTGYLETRLSAEIWPIITASTTAYGIKQVLLKYAKKTGVPADFVKFQSHDFSFRGMMTDQAAISVGLGHLAHFEGSDNVPAILTAGHGGSVIATEHSQMEARGKEGEYDTYVALLENNPTGILSIVSDTYNIYNVLDNFLPRLKTEITKRLESGHPLVIRPDSGDAIEILLGGAKLVHPEATSKDKTNAKLGLFKLIEKHFGSTKNKAGYKILPITFLWGEGCTPSMIDKLLHKMEVAGYASSNVVFGAGSYLYQYVTRDTNGFAYKTTYIEKTLPNGVIEPVPTFKDPITDSGVKKSGFGLLAVVNGKLKENVSWEVVNSDKNDLKLLEV